MNQPACENCMFFDFPDGDKVEPGMGTCRRISAADDPNRDRTDYAFIHSDPWSKPRFSPYLLVSPGFSCYMWTPRPTTKEAAK